MGSAKKKKAGAGPKFLEAVLHADPKHSKKIQALLKKPGKAPALRAAIFDELGKDVHLETPPRWLVIEDGDVGQVLRLESPMFVTTAADGDVFFGEFEKDRLVYKNGKKAEFFSKESDSGEGKTTPVSDRDVKKIDSFETTSDVVLTDIAWIDPVPKSLKDFSALLKKAADALFGEMDGYDAKDHDDAGHPSAPVQSGGAQAYFLGGEERSGAFALHGPRSQPKIAWRAEWIGDGGEWGGNAIVADGVVYAGGGNRESTHVAALDPKNG